MANIQRNDRRQFRISDFGFRIGRKRAASESAIPGTPWVPQSTIDSRRGAVAVEFAIVAPLLLVIVLGTIQMGRAFEMQNLLEVAAREGARFASMDRDELLEPDDDATEKLIQDVENFLAANGVPRDDITVTVKDFENPEDDFAIDDPENDLKLFTVEISVPWSSVSVMPVSSSSDYALSADVVFRNGRATISD